jgi:hypothetical protein
MAYLGAENVKTVFADSLGYRETSDSLCSVVKRSNPAILIYSEYSIIDVVKNEFA